MHAAIFDDRQLKIAVEGGGRDWMPFHVSKPIRNRQSERDEHCEGEAAPAAIGAAPVNCFPIALPQSDSGLQSNP
jgi:hypothetical protein